MRRALDETQERLAERAGVSVKYVQAIEGGRENLTIGSATRIAALLRVSLLELFRRPRTLASRPGRPPRAIRAKRPRGIHRGQ